MQTSEVMHHVGKLRSTDHRIVIVYPQNPHDPSSCLVVNCDALHPRLHDALMDVVQKEGQASPVLANVLQRRIFTDTGVDLMNSLHIANAFQAEPIDNVVLFPKPNMPVPLRVALGGTAPAPQPFVEQQQSLRPPMEAPQPMSNTMLDADTFNPHAHNTVAGRAEENIAVARNIIFEAEMLEGEAARKREQAYALVPSLRPVVNPALTTAVQSPSETAPVAVTASTPKKAVAKTTTAKPRAKKAAAK